MLFPGTATQAWSIVCGLRATWICWWIPLPTGTDASLVVNGGCYSASRERQSVRDSHSEHSGNCAEHTHHSLLLCLSVVPALPFELPATQPQACHLHGKSLILNHARCGACTAKDRTGLQKILLNCKSVHCARMYIQPCDEAT